MAYHCNIFSAVMFTDSTALATVIVIKLYPPHLSTRIYTLLGIQRWHKMKSLSISLEAGFFVIKVRSATSTGKIRWQY
jgi:hypothetical protein